MKLIDAIKIPGKGRFEIPDTIRDELPSFFKQLEFTTGAEIGVYQGQYTKKFLELGLTMYGVDPWEVYPDYSHKRGRNMDKQEKLYQETMQTIGHYPNFHLVRKKSMDALKDFKDKSLDFVYIDAHHGFKYVTEDIWEWTKKIKKGGIIAGHDYGVLRRKKSTYDMYNNHVKYVIDSYTQATLIPRWYVLGSRRPKPNEQWEPWRSWFWFIND